MKLFAQIGTRRFSIHMERGYDISIPIRFDESQLAVFGTLPAQKGTYAVDDFIGSVARGGSCNCDTLHLTPHLNGTHTECVGHITAENILVHHVAPPGLLGATLISVLPDNAIESGESYHASLRPTDRFITQRAIETALNHADQAFLEALIIRTLPNTPDKPIFDYNTTLPAFFSNEALHHIVTRGITHLLVDIPSIDRLDDGGTLSNHRIFWEVDAPNCHIGQNPSQRTVTELVYAPDELADGRYVLNLQVAPILSDAAPSKPILYEVCDE